MGTKKYKPITPGFRQRRVNDYASLTSDISEKSLTKSKKKYIGKKQYW